MPPLPVPSVRASIQTWSPLLDRRHPFKVTLFLSVFVTVLRSIRLFVAYRKRRMSRSGISREDSLMDQDKKRNIKQRKDSSYDEELHTVMEAGQEKEPTPKRVGDSTPLRPSLDKESNQYLQSLQKETLRPSLLPIYPWIAPPQTLPGPYDAPYYPLPSPTIKPEKSIDSQTKLPNVKLEETSDDMPEEHESISYTRRVSTSSIPDHESLLEGSITISTKGWRRTQWTVTAG
jgi:hypothetical protein